MAAGVGAVEGLDGRRAQRTNAAGYHSRYYAGLQFPMDDHRLRSPARRFVEI
jgi:hypothetical protein